MKSKTEGKRKIPKILFALLLSVAVILIVSFTVGKDIYEGRSQTLLSFSLIHFSGYLFFLLMPVEMAFLYYLNWYDETVLIWFALVTATIAQFIDYLIGFTINSRAITRLVSEKRILRAENYINRYGNLTIFCLISCPSHRLIALAAGVLKIDLKDMFIYSITGLFLKYLVLSLMAGWFL
jgi:membrane protein YqaA with SNARE-associated domain